MAKVFTLQRALFPGRKHLAPRPTHVPKSKGAKTEIEGNSGIIADRSEHNRLQADSFDDSVQHFLLPLPESIVKRLETIVDSAKNISAESRIVDVGSGTGCLIPHFQARGARDILAVDLSAKMLQALEDRFGNPGTLGNDSGVRTWQGDIIDLPDYMGPADVIFMNGVFGNIHSQEKALLRSSLLLRPGGQIVISHPLGRNWHLNYRQKNMQIVPHTLPTREEIGEMTDQLPLELVEFINDDNLYVSVLEVPSCYSFEGSPVRMEGLVIEGIGRGSKEMGFPTANLDSEPLQELLTELSSGVYFGFASLQPLPGAPAEDSDVYPMVVNIGKRPTFEDRNEMSIETHILHDYKNNFHGCKLKLVLLGFIRPEIKFSGLQELVSRIKADVGLAKSQLQSTDLISHKMDPYFNWR